MSYPRSGEEKNLEPNLAHLRANIPGAEQKHTAGTSKVCIERLALACNRVPGFAPKPALRSTEWSEIDSRRLPANSGHPSRVYPALLSAYRTTPGHERENQPLNDRNSGIATPSLAAIRSNPFLRWSRRVH